MYTKDEVARIAPGYRGKIENFDPSRKGNKGKFGPVNKEIPKELPAPTKREVMQKTPQVNHNLWEEAFFAPQMNVRELETNVEFTPSFARLSDLTKEVYSHFQSEDHMLNKSLTEAMMTYYNVSLLWARLLDIKSKRAQDVLSNTELEYMKVFTGMDWNVPQPIYLYLKAIGNVRDKTGKEIHLRDHSLPVAQGGGRTGYHDNAINTATHNLFEELPSLGICGDVLQAQAAGLAVATVGILAEGQVASENMTGYKDPVLITKEEVRIVLTSFGIAGDAFEASVPDTRLNTRLVQYISDYLGKTTTYRVEKVNIQALTREGDAVQLIRCVPTTENANAATKWTHKIVRPTAANAESPATFGAAYFTGFQTSKETTGENNHTNWCCLTEVPAAWILNRNARRALPPGLSVGRFVSVSDSQVAVTNAIVRRMITSSR